MSAPPPLGGGGTGGSPPALHFFEGLDEQDFEELQASLMLLEHDGPLNNNLPPPSFSTGGGGQTSSLNSMPVAMPISSPSFSAAWEEELSRQLLSSNGNNNNNGATFPVPFSSSSTSTSYFPTSMVIGTASTSGAREEARGEPMNPTSPTGGSSSNKRASAGGVRSKLTKTGKVVAAAAAAAKMGDNSSNVTLINPAAANGDYYTNLIGAGGEENTPLVDALSIVVPKTAFVSDLIEERQLSPHIQPKFLEQQNLANNYRLALTTIFRKRYYRYDNKALQCFPFCAKFKDVRDARLRGLDHASGAVTTVPPPVPGGSPPGPPTSSWCSFPVLATLEIPLEANPATLVVAGRFLSATPEVGVIPGSGHQSLLKLGDTLETLANHDWAFGKIVVLTMGGVPMIDPHTRRRATHVSIMPPFGPSGGNWLFDVELQRHRRNPYEQPLKVPSFVFEVIVFAQRGGGGGGGAQGSRKPSGASPSSSPSGGSSVLAAALAAGIGHIGGGSDNSSSSSATGSSSSHVRFEVVARTVSGVFEIASVRTLLREALIFRKSLYTAATGNPAPGSTTPPAIGSPNTSNTSRGSLLRRTLFPTSSNVSSTASTTSTLSSSSPTSPGDASVPPARVNKIARTGSNSSIATSATSLSTDSFINRFREEMTLTNAALASVGVNRKNASASSAAPSGGSNANNNNNNTLLSMLSDPSFSFSDGDDSMILAPPPSVKSDSGNSEGTGAKSWFNRKLFSSSSSSS